MSERPGVRLALTRVAKVAGAVALLYFLVLGGDRLYSGGKRTVDPEAYSSVRVFETEADYANSSDYGFMSAMSRHEGFEQPDPTAYNISGFMVPPGTVVELVDRASVISRGQKLVWIKVPDDADRLWDIRGKEGLTLCHSLLTLGLGRESC